MKTWERLLLDNPPFYPDSSTDEEKMRFMFLLEDGRLVGDSEGRNHRDLMGWTTEDGDSTLAELRELLYPAAQTVKTKKTRQSKRSPVRNR